MAFNYKKLLELHKLSGERSIDFSRAIFGDNSSLGPTYFKGKTEINTRHLEKMVVHYNVPFDYFFDESQSPQSSNIGNIVSHNRLGVGNLNINNDVKLLQQTITRLEKEISDKDEMINWLRRQCDVLSGLLKDPRKDSPESETEMGQNK